MNILLTNDDGFGSRGINALKTRLSVEHKVCVVAPSSNRSGASCSVSVGQNLSVEKISSAEYALSGTPVDCALFALRGKTFAEPFDLVLSGINDGYNLGTDILYSGTCGAARQAALYGVPALALSIGSTENTEYFDSLADWCAKNIKKLIALCKNSRNKDEGEDSACFLNINAPPAVAFKGALFATPCKRHYGDAVSLFKGEDGKIYSRCMGYEETKSVGNSVSDSACVENGFISVSVVYAHPSADSHLCGTSF